MYFANKGGRSGTSSALELRSKMMSTAFSLSLSDGSSSTSTLKAPLVQQGAGMINALKLIDYTTVVLSDHSLELNSTEFRVSTHQITLRNDGTDEKVFQITHEAAATVETRDSSSLLVNAFMPPTSGSEASVSLSQTELTLGPGETKSISVSIEAPSSPDVGTAPIFSGKIVFTSDSEIIAVPYMGEYNFSIVFCSSA